MRIIVCGGRNYANKVGAFLLLDQVHAEYHITNIIEGGARGADRLARDWAIYRDIPFTTVNSNWDQFGKSAGYKRNVRMATEFKPDAVIAFPGGVGTQHMITIAKQRKLEVLEVTE